MKKIKIFFASSEELKNDRDAFGNLVRRLNKTYEKRGITLDLFEWEDYDAAFNDKRKQEEYNEEVRKSDMFLAVFHRNAGRFTIEEHRTLFVLGVHDVEIVLTLLIALLKHIITILSQKQLIKGLSYLIYHIQTRSTCLFYGQLHIGFSQFGRSCRVYAYSDR